MAVRTVNLSVESATVGTIYFNTSTKAWYSDADCQTQISAVAVPTRLKYRFDGYRFANSSTATLYIDASGNIVYTPSWTSSGTTTLYSRWTQISKRFYFENDTWTGRTLEFFRSVAADTHFYSDDKLTDEITSIELPYKAGRSCHGLWTYSTETGETVWLIEMIDVNGKFTGEGLFTTSTATSDLNFGKYIRSAQCYKMTCDANGGTGGPANALWFDNVRSRWCSDDVMLQPITKISTLPTCAGKIFKGYYTATSGGTQVIAADGTIGTYAAVASANKTVYAQWATPVTITANHGSGTGAFTNLYYGGGQFFVSSELTTAVASVAVPTLAYHKFLGYYSTASGGTQYIDADGKILAAFAPTKAVTIYAQYQRVAYPITISQKGGGGVAELYADASKAAVYADAQCAGAALSSITPLTKAGYRFLGLYATDGVGGTQLAAASGAFTSAMSEFVAAMGDSATIYAEWQAVYTITLDGQGGGGSPGEIYFDDAYNQFYDAAAMTAPVAKITPPALECNTFKGYYTAISGGTLRIAADGTIGSGWTPTASTTLYAQWTRKSYKYTLDADGGTATQGAIYNSGADGAYYADDQLKTAATSVEIPTKPGYSFAGYFDGETCVVAASGEVSVSSALTANATATAKWTAQTYTVTFDYNGGTGATATKAVTFGEAIGELPTATRKRAYFTGWNIDGETLTAETAWKWPQTRTATANWDLEFGGVVDYFGLKSAVLTPISSNSGDDVQRICVCHTGKYESGVNQTSGVWRNPTVTYAVTKSGTVSVTLGKAYSGSGTTRSGYMITSVAVATQVGQFPTVTVAATANEGKNAINTWTVVIPVVARSRAQNLLGGVSGGGKLNSCAVVATCDPVVIAENLMPCASDIVHGRIELTATTIATGTEAEPTASGGFTALGAPKIGAEAYYTTYQLKARKEL